MSTVIWIIVVGLAFNVGVILGAWWALYKRGPWRQR